MSLHLHDYMDSPVEVEDISYFTIGRGNSRTLVLDAEINEAVALSKFTKLKSDKAIDSNTEELETFFEAETENFIWSAITSDSTSVFESTYWTTFRNESHKPDLKDQKGNIKHVLFKSAHEQIRSFLTLKDGWDGDGSLAPKEEVVKDAIRFLENWSNTSIIPAPELMFYGIVTFQFYCAKGRSLGAIEFNESHRGVYSVLNKNMEFESGYFDASSINEIESAINKILLVLQSNNN